MLEGPRSGMYVFVLGEQRHYSIKKIPVLQSLLRKLPGYGIDHVAELRRGRELPARPIWYTDTHRYMRKNARKGVRSWFTPLESG